MTWYCIVDVVEAVQAVHTRDINESRIHEFSAIREIHCIVCPGCIDTNTTEWIPVGQFDDLACIDEYWRRRTNQARPSTRRKKTQLPLHAPPTDTGDPLDPDAEMPATPVVTGEYMLRRRPASRATCTP